MKVRLVTLAAIAFVSFPASAGAACPVPDIDEQLAEAHAVFVGDVIATSDHDRVAEMQVTSIWKGLDLPELVTVAGTFEEGGPISAEDARFTVGRRYLVIPENTREPFVATKCSATIPIRATGTLIPPAYQEAVGAETGKEPLAPKVSVAVSEGADGTLALGLAAVGISVSGFGWLVSRKSRKERSRMAEEPIEHAPRPESERTRKHRLSLDGLLTRLTTPSAMSRAAHNRIKSKRMRSRYERRQARRAQRAG
jgi:hypothetical protein